MTIPGEAADAHTCVQPPSMSCAACMDVYGDPEFTDEELALLSDGPETDATSPVRR
jgi:hypothetical protein